MNALSHIFRSAPAILILAGLCGWLAVTLAQTLTKEPRARVIASIDPANTPSEAEAAPMLEALPPLGAYAEVFARPLFTPNRLPPKAMATSVATPGPAQPAVEEPVIRQAPPPRISLAGTLLIADKPKALIVFEQTRQSEWLAIGAEIEAWRITEIAHRRVTLAKDGQELVIDARRSE